MASLIDRVNQKGGQSAENTEKYYGNSFDYWLGVAGTDTNGDFRASEYGVAQLYGAVSGANAALNKWQDWVGGQTFELRKKRTDEVIYKSTDTDLSDNVRIPNFVLAMKDYRRTYKHSLFASIAFADHLYAERYFYVKQNRMARDVLQWLNPLYTRPDIRQGRIAGYYYSADDALVEGKTHLAIRDVVYHIYRRNAQNDLRGYPPLLSILNSANISRDVKRAFLGYFRNGMILGGVMMPDGENTNLHKKQIDELERQMQRNHRGVDNAYKWAIPPVKMTFEQFSQPDIEKNWSVIKPIRDEIMMVLQVPPQVAGDPSNANYDNAADVERNWITSTAVPYLNRVANELNEDVLPLFDGDLYLAFLTDQYQVDDVDSISKALSASVIPIDVSQRRGGYSVDDKLEGIYIIGGQPMHRDIIAQVAMRMPVQTQPMALQAVSAPPATQKAQPVANEAFAYLPIANNRDYLKVQRELKALFPDNRIEWQIPSTAHITLCYAKRMSDSGIDNIVPMLDMQAMSLSPIQDSLAVFDTPQGQALYIAIDHIEALDRLQASVYDAFTLEGSDISEFSQPDSYQPHVTLAYIPDDIVIDLTALNSRFSWLSDVVFDCENLVIGRDDYDPIVTIRAPQYTKHQPHHHDKSIAIGCGHGTLVETFEPSHETPHDELQAWRKVALKKWTRDFSPIWLRGDIADALQSAIVASNGDKGQIVAIFDNAKAFADTWFKAIQATRLDFELDFEELLKRARDTNNNYGRRQWSSAVRSIIRRYGRRAFEDGLTEGGVIDGLSEEDENTIAALISEQSQYVTNLGNEIFRTEAGISDALANQKPDMWYRKSIAPFYDAGRESSMGNAMMEFAGDDGDESCTTCQRLKGQRHRMKSWARKGLRPGVDTDNFECGGWKCEHKLVRVSAKARGTF